MDDAKLRPCPFCGRDAELDEQNGHGWFVGCNYAVACDVAPSCWADTKDEAVDIWNGIKTKT